MTLKKSEEHVFFFFPINKDAEQQSIEMAKKLEKKLFNSHLHCSQTSALSWSCLLIVKSTKFMGGYQNELTNKYNTHS